MSVNMVKKEKETTFEENLKKLEDIVDQLESGEIDLEESVELYEKGMILKNNCEAKLKIVELQIKKIKFENDKIKKENFEK
jgi:exodeoxyribonuclease VII small subunit